MNIAVIILHYGKMSVTLDCIKSLYKNDNTFSSLFLVNNSLQTFFKKDVGNYESIEVIHNKMNLGFAGGVNRGINHALRKNADYVVLLNNDTLIDKPFMKEIVSFMEKNTSIGIAGPAIKFYKNTKVMYDIGGKVNKFFGRTKHVEVSSIIDKTPRAVDYVSGCCMVIKKEVIRKVGLFDESFFLYYEDVDYCLRAKKAGYYTYIFPKSQIFHELSKSAGKASRIAVYNQTKSALIFGKKHLSFLRRLANVCFILVQSKIIFLKNPQRFMPLIQGLRDGVFA